MKRIFLLSALAVLLSSCINEDGLEIKLPATLARQWISVSDDPEDEYPVLLWDFLSFENSLTFVYFHSVDDMKLFPQYYSRSSNVFPLTCRKKGDIYTVTIADEDNTKYYFTEVTSQSAIVTDSEGYQWHLERCPVKVSAVPVD